MARIAGSSSHYQFRLVRAVLDEDGQPIPDEWKPTPHGFGFPSVTTVIKAVLGGPPPEWGFKVAMDGYDLLRERGYDLDVPSSALRELLTENGQTPWGIRDEGGVRGTRVHSYFESLARGEPAKPSDGYERAVRDWWVERKPKVVATEVPLFSLRHRVAGTLDLGWTMRGTPVPPPLTITDLKTHKPMKGKQGPARPEDRLQNTAYRFMWNEMVELGYLAADPVERTSVLVACEDGTYLEDDKEQFTFDDFLAVLSVYRALKGER